MTICEAITYVFTCGKAFEEKNKMALDNYEFKEIVVEDDGMSDLNSKVVQGKITDIKSKVEK